MMSVPIPRRIEFWLHARQERVVETFVSRSVRMNLNPRKVSIWPAARALTVL